MRIFIILFFLIMSNNVMATQTAYEFSFKQMGNKDFKLSDLKGKVILVVNTASKCGFTKQYAGLEKLYKKYQEQDFIVIAVPSNDFGGQEPGNDEEIHDFCQLNFGVSFPVVNKEIVSGDNAHPFYLWAKKELGFMSAPKWNFHKYLIDRNGNLIDYFYSTTDPENDKIINSIESALKEHSQK